MQRNKQGAMERKTQKEVCKGIKKPGYHPGENRRSGSYTGYHLWWYQLFLDRRAGLRTGAPSENRPTLVCKHQVQLIVVLLASCCYTAALLHSEAPFSSPSSSLDTTNKHWATDHELALVSSSLSISLMSHILSIFQ